MNCEIITENANLDRANMHKSCGGAINEALWHVAIVRPRYERICRSIITSMGIDAYVATQKELHQYASRNKREVEKIVIPRMVFVQVKNEEERLSILKGCPYIDRFMINPSSSSRSFALVPDHQIKKLKYILFESDEPVTYIPSPLSLGERIRILRGPLMGLEGYVRKVGGNSYVAVEISHLGYAMTSIPANDVETID